MEPSAVLRLAKHVISAADARDRNSVFSPASFTVVLSLIAAGSGGSSRDQILSFLHFPSTDDLISAASEIVSTVVSGGLKISAATGVWIDESLSFKPSFKELLESSYKAASEHVDFKNKAVEVIREVNSWAENETNGLIKDLLPPDSIDGSTKLVFANALYFKGAWAKPFDAKLTKDGDFCLLDGSSVRVPFMTSDEDQYVRAYNGFKVLRLRYVEGSHKFSLYIYLPDETDGLEALVEKICSDSGFLDRHVPHWRDEIGEFRVPKFQFSFGFEASEVLKGMGLTSAFRGGLTEMIDSEAVGESLYVSNIFHKSFIEVNEEGTEAAVASAVEIRPMCASEETDFVADHPFLFLVRDDESGLILFMGQVLDPSVH